MKKYTKKDYEAMPINKYGYKKFPSTDVFYIEMADACIRKLKPINN